MITSKKNPRLQFVRDLLQTRKARDENNLFVIEGVRLVEDALNHGADFLEVYFSNALSDRGNQLLKKFESRQLPVEEVDEDVFTSIMDTSTSQGIAAVCRKPALTMEKNLDFVIVADQLRDPGNLGTLIRTAASAGAQAVITTPDSVDLYSPKVLRSAMGAHFHIPCTEMDWQSIAELKRTNNPKGMSAWVAAANGDMACWQSDFTSPVMLIIGSEADGATEAAFQLADHRLSIPMPGKMESLNAAVAAGILIFEVVRQRSN